MTQSFCSEVRGRAGGSSGMVSIRVEDGPSSADIDSRLGDLLPSFDKGSQFGKDVGETRKSSSTSAAEAAVPADEQREPREEHRSTSGEATLSAAAATSDLWVL